MRIFNYRHEEAFTENTSGLFTLLNLPTLNFQIFFDSMICLLAAHWRSCVPYSTHKNKSLYEKKHVSIYQ